jgi:hypothetical protein
MTPRCSALISWITLGLAAAGCTTDATQLIVAVNSDLRAGDELREIRVFLLDAPLALPPSAYDEKIFPVLPGGLPFSFGVVPREDDNEQIVLRFDAINEPMDGPLFVHRAVTEFRAEKSLRLPIFLTRACIANFPCPQESLTCRGDGTCGSDRYDPETLKEVQPQRELEDLVWPRPRPDGGQPPPVDGGQPDAGNGSPPDSGVMGPPSCTTEAECRSTPPCPPDALAGCTCADTPNGKACIAKCSNDADCPTPPGGGSLHCDTAMGICVP